MFAYATYALDLVEGALGGGNALLLSYGGAGSGKSQTLVSKFWPLKTKSTEEERGLYPVCSASDGLHRSRGSVEVATWEPFDWEDMLMLQLTVYYSMATRRSNSQGGGHQRGQQSKGGRGSGGRCLFVAFINSYCGIQVGSAGEVNLGSFSRAV